jgi:hypothetical protein
MAEEKFKLPRSSFDELVKIIRAYGHLQAPVSLDEVSRVAAMHQTRISANAGFLLGVGIIEGGAKKQATAKGRQLSRALEHEMPDEMRQSWRTVIAEADFLSRLLTAIRIRKGMDGDTLEAHIAYSAGQPKTSQVMTGARTVIDILRAAELVVESDGKFTAKEDIGGQGFKPESLTPPVKDTPTPPQVVAPTVTVQAPGLVAANSGAGVLVQVNIQLRIDCSANQLTGLGAKIKAVIDDIAAFPQSPKPVELEKDAKEDESTSEAADTVNSGQDTN